jgi:hypothetical protein
MFPTDKTIPYRPSRAELESLRILRKKTNPSDQDNGEDKLAGGNQGEVSDQEPIHHDNEEKSQ